MDTLWSDTPVRIHTRPTIFSAAFSAGSLLEEVPDRMAPTEPSLKSLIGHLHIFFVRPLLQQTCTYKALVGH